jgi:hypothetical protein
MSDKLHTFETLDLNVETLRELTDEQLGGVAGGAGAVSGIPCNPTYFVPSQGGAWTMMCPITTN